MLMSFFLKHFWTYILKISNRPAHTCNKALYQVGLDLLQIGLVEDRGLDLGTTLIFTGKLLSAKSLYRRLASFHLSPQI